MKEPTKRERYEQILTYVADNAELVAFVNHELELLAKKNASKSGKQTNRQKENADLMTVIYNAMEAEKKYRVTDLIKEIPELNGMNTQRVAPILTKMRENVLVAREVVKGVAYFTKI